jgi:hypothetical protein
LGGGDSNSGGSIFNITSKFWNVGVNCPIEGLNQYSHHIKSQVIIANTLNNMKKRSNKKYYPNSRIPSITLIMRSRRGHPITRVA